MHPALATLAAALLRDRTGPRRAFTVGLVGIGRAWVLPLNGRWFAVPQ